jgi:hypothetical protein
MIIKNGKGWFTLEAKIKKGLKKLYEEAHPMGSNYKEIERFSMTLFLFSQLSY